MSFRKKFAMAALSASLLSACTSTNQVNTQLTETWIGLPAKEFFLKHGMPIAEFKVDETTTMYKWSSGVETMQQIGFANTTYNGNQIGNTMTLNSNTTYTGGGEWRFECQAQITAVNGAITDIKLKDSFGKWRLSRCDEIFN